MQTSLQPAETGEAGPGFIRRYIVNRQTVRAIFLATPVILSAIGSIAMAGWIDRQIAVLQKDRDDLAATITELERFADRVENHELDRASMLLVLTAGNAEPRLRYAMDRLFRVNALASMRRAAAILYPDDWAKRMAPYEAAVAQDYADPGTIAELQASEDGMLADAARKLTGLQAGLDAAERRLAQETDRKNVVIIGGNAVMYIISILFFFIRTSQADPRWAMAASAAASGAGAAQAKSIDKA